MTPASPRSDIEAPTVKTDIAQRYRQDISMDNEDSPLFPTAGKMRRHQFEAAESTSYFPREGFLKEIFLRENSMLRFKLYCVWGSLSLAVGYFILKYSFEFPSGKSFFIVAATLSSVGYGPTFDTIVLHKFLSYFTVCHVLPYIFMQFLVANDSMLKFSENFKRKIKHRNESVGTKHSLCFQIELRGALLRSVVLLTVLIIVGTVIFKYMTAELAWIDALFFAITSVTSIGNGNFTINSGTPGYILIGLYALLCNSSLAGYLLPRVLSFWTLAVENAEINSKINSKNERSKTSPFEFQQQIPDKIEEINNLQNVYRNTISYENSSISKHTKTKKANICNNNSNCNNDIIIKLDVVRSIKNDDVDIINDDLIKCTPSIQLTKSEINEKTQKKMKSDRDQNCKKININDKKVHFEDSIDL